MKQQHEALWRLLGLIVSALVTAVMGLLATHLLRDESSSASTGGPLRDCVVRPTGETLDDVGGLEQTKEELRRAVLLPLRHPDVFFGGPRALRPPRGVLLHGPPGTGKTMLARALASESGVPFLSLTPAALESKYYGDSSKLIQAAFALARKELAPCIVFLDEIDGMGRTRTGLDDAHVHSFKTELLRNMDGVEGDGGAAVVTLACTNCPQLLDPALRRRFPKVVHVDKPDESARLAILRVLLRDEPEACSERVLERVAKATAGKTGSDLAALYAEASARRFDREALEDALARGEDADGVLANAGPLRLRHWAAAGA